MMVETILESSQDFAGMSSGTLPQWKRELLQRRLARARPPAAPPAPPPPPPPPPPSADDDEELRYGPGIVKRLKSRYLSLALRDAPRRRPSVLRRAASLEHLLDERPPPAPRRAPAQPPLAPRRDAVKRARSVDALSRLEPRDEPAPAPAPAPRSPDPRPSAPRAARPPRRPQPLLRETERPPPDVVRETLRKFESAPPRRAAPAARVSAVLRGLEPRRSPTPERTQPREPPASPPPPLPTGSPPPPPLVDSSAAPIEDPPRSPSPAAEPPAESPVTPRTPAAAIAPTAIDERRLDSTPEPVSAAKPNPAPRSPPPTPAPAPGADEVEGCGPGARLVSRAALEGIARAGCSVRYAFSATRGADHLPPLAAVNPVLARAPRRVGVIRPMPAARPPPDPPRTPEPPLDAKAEARPALVNGHSTPEPSALSRIGAAGIERAWSGSAVESIAAQGQGQGQAGAGAEARPAWLRAGAGRGRAPPPPATSVVFNFSNRKEVPDYIENDGIILRASRRNRIKCGEPGVVVLSVDTQAEGEGEAEAGPPSPCDVRFVNDNVLINGKSSMPCKPNKDRIAKLKLQFDDSLTRTFEYPSETSLCEEVPPPCPSPTAPAPAPAPPDNSATLADNTHIVSAALSGYTPSKTCAAAFQLGLASPHAPSTVAVNGTRAPEEVGGGEESAGAGGEEGADARPCGADAARSWSDARAHRTDLLF